MVVPRTELAVGFNKEGCQTRTMPAQFRVWIPVYANPAFRKADILISFS
jgi:hypothetical protein